MYYQGRHAYKCIHIPVQDVLINARIPGLSMYYQCRHAYKCVHIPVQDVLHKLSFTAAGELCPMAAMFGGVVGQEVMKAASGKFHPLYQFFYFDSIESLPEEALSPEDVAPLVRHKSQLPSWVSHMSIVLTSSRFTYSFTGCLK